MWRTSGCTPCIDEKSNYNFDGVVYREMWDEKKLQWEISSCSADRISQAIRNIVFCLLTPDMRIQLAVEFQC